MATEEAITEENENQKIRRTCLNDVLKIIDDCKTNKGIKLDLSNRLVNLIPDELLQLSHIQYLYLERSHLQEIPESISEYLTQLKWLDVRHNNLKCLPQNLFLLKNLKNLLLEGNELISLPLKLGLLTSLSGLNLTNNPLEFPPKYVIESGTKAILQFLREQLAIEQRFGQMELNDVAPNSKRTLQVHGKIHKNPYVEKTTPPVESCTVGYDESTTDDEYSVYQHSPPEDHYSDLARRRHSLEEEMLNSPPYSISSLLIREREKSARRRNEHSSSAPMQKVRQPKRNTDMRNAPKPNRQHGYFRSETFDSTYERATKNAEQKAFNEKADAIIQKRKDKINLNEWRWKTKQLQAKKYRSRPTKHKVKLPFGNEFQKNDQPIGKHAKDVSEVLNKDQSERMRVSRDKQLEDRIQEHAKHIREWKQKEKIESMEDQLAIAKSNLEKALNLQKELEDKRALQYRLRAFTAEDFVPKSHADPSIPKTQHI